LAGAAPAAPPCYAMRSDRKNTMQNARDRHHVVIVVPRIFAGSRPHSPSTLVARRTAFATEGAQEHAW
jgi:hypothetical protein